MYDPVIGRILSPDPLVQSPTYTQNYNRYSYCLNNPLKYTDPSGYTYKPDDWNKTPQSGYYTFSDGGGAGAVPDPFWSNWFAFGSSCPIGDNKEPFIQQLYKAGCNIINSNLPDGVYTLSGINNNHGNYEFSAQIPDDCASRLSAGADPAGPGAGPSGPSGGRPEAGDAASSWPARARPRAAEDREIGRAHV